MSSKIKLPEEQRMDEKKIINGVSAEQIAGSDGRDPQPGKIKPRCSQCGSQDLRFLGTEVIEERKVVRNHYQCRNCGHTW